MSNIRELQLLILGKTPRSTITRSVLAAPVVALAALLWLATINFLESILPGEIPFVLMVGGVVLVPMIAVVLSIYFRVGAVSGFILGAAFCIGSSAIFWDHRMSTVENIESLLIVGTLLGVFFGLIGMLIGIVISIRQAGSGGNGNPSTETLID